MQMNFLHPDGLVFIPEHGIQKCHHRWTHHFGNHAQTANCIEHHHIVHPRADKLCAGFFIHGLGYDAQIRIEATCRKRHKQIVGIRM